MGGFPYILFECGRLYARHRNKNRNFYEELRVMKRKYSSIKNHNEIAMVILWKMEGETVSIIFDYLHKKYLISSIRKNNEWIMRVKWIGRLYNSCFLFMGSNRRESDGGLLPTLPFMTSLHYSTLCDTIFLWYPFLFIQAQSSSRHLIDEWQCTWTHLSDCIISVFR